MKRKKNKRIRGMGNGKRRNRYLGRKSDLSMNIEQGENQRLKLRAKSKKRTRKKYFRPRKKLYALEILPCLISCFQQ